MDTDLSLFVEDSEENDHYGTTIWRYYKDLCNQSKGKGANSRLRIYTTCTFCTFAAVLSLIVIHPEPLHIYLVVKFLLKSEWY